MAICARPLWILNDPGPSLGKRPALAPTSASYLAHVALECGIKARLLYRGGVFSIDDLQSKQPRVYETLFRSRTGHDLAQLASEVNLAGVMAAEGKPLNQDACWRRMTAPTRPYSLRYGAENVEETHVKEEVNRSNDILDVVLSGIGRLRPSGRRRRRR